MNLIRTEILIQIYGNITQSDNLPGAGCLAVIWDTKNSKEMFRAQTDAEGHYEFLLNKDVLPPGEYELRFYGTGNPQKLQPEGDWEAFKIDDLSIPSWVQIIADKGNIIKYKNGICTPASVVLTATTYQVDNPTYKWYVDDVLQSETSDAFTLVTAPIFTSADTTIIECKVDGFKQDGSPTGTLSGKIVLYKTQDGGPGPGIVYRGKYDDQGTVYISTDARKDVVHIIVDGKKAYRRCISDGATGTYDPAKWDTFGDDFSSIATGLLLSEMSTVTNTLTVGTEGSLIGIIRSANAETATSGNGFYMSAEFEGGLFRVGAFDDSNTLLKGVYWDGTDLRVKGSNFELTPTSLTLTGIIHATSGYFGNDQNKIDTNGLRINDGNYDRVKITNQADFSPYSTYHGAEKILNGNFEDDAHGGSNMSAGWTFTGSATTSRQGSAPSDENYSTSGDSGVLYIDSKTATASQTFEITTDDVGKTFVVTWWGKINYYAEYRIYITTNTKAWNGTGWVSNTTTYQEFYSSGDWTKKSFNFVAAEAGTHTFKLEIIDGYNGGGIPYCGGGASSSHPLFIDDISIRSFENFVELNCAGLQVWNSPSNYIRIGKNGFEFKGKDLEFQDVNITNTLEVRGSTDFYGPITIHDDLVYMGTTSTVSGMNILNYDGQTSTEGSIANSQYISYYGFEIGANAAANPMLVYYGYDSRWYLTSRASSSINIGQQTNDGNTEVSFLVANRIVTAGSTDTLTNKTWAGNDIPVSKGGLGGHSYAKGDLIYSDATDSLARLAVGVQGQVLAASSSGIPSWSNSIGKLGDTITVSGDLFVAGTLSFGNSTTISSTTIAVDDNIITLNSGVTGSPMLNSGIEIERGDSPNASIIWDEVNDKWTLDKIGATGTLDDIVTITSTQPLTNKTYEGLTIAATTSTLTLAKNFTVNTGDVTLVGNASGTTATLPASGSITLVDLGTTQTLNGAKTFTGGVTFSTSNVTLSSNITGSGFYQAGVIVTTYGGTGLASYTAGDILYYASGTTLSKVGIGANKTVMQSDGSKPVWKTNLDIGTGTIDSGTITSSGNLVFSGSTHSLGSSVFSSGFTGQGWKLSGGSTGTNLEIDGLTVRGTMQVYELLIQQIKATNGSLMVASSATVDSISVSTVGAEVLDVEDPSNHNAAPFAVNDLVICQRIALNGTTVVKRLVRKVSSTNGKTVTFTTLSDAPVDAGVIEKGDVFVRFGNASVTTRQGSVYLTSDDSNAPFINITDGVTSWTDWVNVTGTKLKARLGNLKGITDASLGLNDTATYGLYSNSVYLKGNLVVGGGQGITLANSTVAIGNVTGTANNAIKLADTGTASTSGLFGYDNTGNEVFSLRLNNTANIAGWGFNRYSLSTTGIVLVSNPVNTRAYIALGAASDISTGIGIWMDGVGNFRAGDPANDYMQYTSSGLIVSGAVTAKTGYIGGTSGWVIAAGKLSSTNIELVSGASAHIAMGSSIPTAYNSGNGIWLGNDGKFLAGDAAGHRLQWNGSAVTVQGVVNATTGYFGNNQNKIDQYGLRINDGVYDRVMITNGTTFTPSSNYMGSQKITNGNFATNDLTGWTVTGSPLPSIGHNNFDPGSDENYAYDGSGAELDLTCGDASTSTTFTVTGVEIGKTFVTTWWTSMFGGYHRYLIYLLNNTNGTYWNGYSWVSGTGSVGEYWATSTWMKFSFNFVPAAAGTYTWKLYVVYENTSGDGTRGATFRLNNVSVRSFENFVELNCAGLQVYNSPDNYIKIGKSSFEVKGQGLTLQDVTLNNTLLVKGASDFYGKVTLHNDFMMMGAVSTASAIQVLNYDASDAIEGAISNTQYLSYYGFELGADSAANPMLVYYGYDNRWYLTSRVSGSTSIGQQTNASNTEVDFAATKRVLTAGSSDTLTNKIWNGSAISDAYLSTISTVGKVSGTAITSGNISTSGSFNTTSTISINSNDITQIVREEEIVGTGGLAEGTVHAIPNGRTYNAWVGSGSGTSYKTNKSMEVYINGWLQKPGASFDYVECDSSGTAVAQYANSGYIKFTYDLVEGAYITYIIRTI